MKRAILVVLVLIGTIAVSSATQVSPTAELKHVMITTPEGPNIGLAATAIQRQAPAMNIIQLKGSVEIRTKDMTLRADEAEYNQDTGEIEARGAVHIKLETDR
jgi:lipopolysaccharide assembly outer membrane protein LptD (OstA)